VGLTAVPLLFAADSAPESLDLHNAEVVPGPGTAGRVLLADACLDFQVDATRTPVRLAAVSLVVGNAESALKGNDALRTGLVPTALAATAERVRIAHTLFYLFIFAARRVVGLAAVAIAGTAIVRCFRTQAIPRIRTTIRVLLAHARHDLFVVAAGPFVAQAASLIDAVSAVFWTDVAPFKQAALPVSAAGAIAAVVIINESHAQVVPCSDAAERVRGADTVGDLPVLAPRAPVRFTAAAFARAPAAILGAGLASRGGGAFAIATNAANAAFEQLYLTDANQIPAKSAAELVLLTNACLDFRVGASRVAMHHTATLRVAEAASQALDLTCTLVVPYEFTTVGINSTDASGYLVVFAAGSIVSLAAGAASFAPAAVLGI